MLIIVTQLEMILHKLRKKCPYDLPGKIVLITGGSCGLGLVLAREFDAAGARIAICARDEDELERARHDLVQCGANVLTVRCDVTKREQVQQMVSQIMAEYGPIDVLVNNAGYIMVGPLEQMQIQDFQDSLDTNFWGALYCILEVLPEMRRRGQGRIINITSQAGRISIPHLLAYSSSKFALAGLSTGLHAELAKDGIVVTTVYPGMIRTGSHGRPPIRADTVSSTPSSR